MSLNEFETQLVTFLDQHYQLTGALLSADAAFKQFGIPAVQFRNAMEKNDVKEALIERGIVFERFDKDAWTSHSLTPVQLLVANSLLDLTDTRTNKKKLQDLDVSTLTYNAWLKDPVFKDYLHKRAEQMIGDNQHEVDAALLDKVRSGDLKAIAYYNEYTGRYTPAASRNTSNIDVGGLIIKIIEIIDDEIDDPVIMRNVGNRLRGLIAARNTANALMGGDDGAIIIPEVVKARVISELES